MNDELARSKLRRRCRVMSLDDEPLQPVTIDLTPRDARLIDYATEILGEDAHAAKSVGYYPSVLAQCTLPHSDTKANEYTRRAGDLRLTVMTPSEYGGVPYGTFPRLLISWMATEAVRTKSATLHLGKSMNAFMSNLAIKPGGGPRGGSTILKQQMLRICASSFYHSWSGSQNTRGTGGGRHAFVDDFILWWDPNYPGQESFWNSELTLSPGFYSELRQSAVPIDQRALQALRKSPLAIDIYVWAAHRTHSLRYPTLVRWESLQLQFGARYGTINDFKKRFVRALRKVKTVYAGLNFTPEDDGLRLLPSVRHIPRNKRASEHDETVPAGPGQGTLAGI